MPRLYDLYKHPEPWDQNLPADLIPPINHLRKLFDNHHWTYGKITETHCYHHLHPDNPDPDIRDYLNPLEQLKGIAGTTATRSFMALLRTGTPPALFKAFLDLYLDAMLAVTLPIFAQLVAVGKANEDRLGVPHLVWAEAQTKNMIRYNMHLIEIWVRNVCDKQPYTPEDMDEQLYWKKWQAPMLLIMKPSRFMTYDAARAWERNDTETSSRWPQAFAEQYVLHLESKLENLAGEVALELAKQPRPPATAASAVPPPEVAPQVAGNPNKPTSSHRDVQKKDTQAKYRSWQKEYSSLKKSHPNQTDTWYSLKISRMAIGRGSSSETIRKHMKMHK
jgi:hypothetical protein